MASPFMVDFSLLRRNPRFRIVFCARMISVFSLGILTVAVPVQLHALTGSSLQVGVVVALDGLFMFLGLMVGGVLADRYDRRRQILLGRGLCGLGFLLLAANGFLATPSVVALYIVSSWDGFFGSIGMTALMAAMPGLVGKEDLGAAGALSMLTVRIGAVLAPLAGGVIIAAGDVSWNYLLAGLGTLGTLVPLRLLPRMVPSPGADRHPLKALLGGLSFAFSNRVIGPVIVIGMFQSLFTALRVLFPALGEAWAAGPVGIGLLYAALPLGAMVGALTSGWVGTIGQPERTCQALVGLGAAVIAAMGLLGSMVIALPLLVLLGYVGSIVFLLQFILVQNHTPDPLLGRVNALKNAQDVIGSSGGALVLGGLAGALQPLTALFCFGAGTLAAVLIVTAAFILRHRQNRTTAAAGSATPVQDLR